MNKLKFFTGLGMISPILSLPIIYIILKILGEITFEIFMTLIVGTCFVLYVGVGIYLILKGLIEKE